MLSNLEVATLILVQSYVNTKPYLLIATGVTCTQQSGTMHMSHNIQFNKML